MTTDTKGYRIFDGTDPVKREDFNYNTARMSAGKADLDAGGKLQTAQKPAYALGEIAGADKVAFVDDSGKLQTAQKPAYALSEIVGADKVPLLDEGGKLQASTIPIASGTTAQYYRGDKNWADFFTSVRAATLSGLSTATNAVIGTADTVLTALGKLQKQISDNLQALSNHTGNTNNPHNVTKAQLGLANVDNTADGAKSVNYASSAGSAARLTTARTINGVSFDGTQNITLPAPPVTSVAGKTGDIALSVENVSGAAPLASPWIYGDPRCVGGMPCSIFGLKNIMCGPTVPDANSMADGDIFFQTEV